MVPGQRRGEGSEAMLGRLEALEADVRFLCTELGAEKLLWSSRFLELLREQQSLRQRVSAWGVPAPPSPLSPRPSHPAQLQELPWQWNSGDSPDLLGEAEDQSASGSEGESPEGRGWELLGRGDLPPGLGSVLTSANGHGHQLTPGHWVVMGSLGGAGKSSQFPIPTRSLAGCSQWCPLSLLSSFPGHQWMEAPRQPRGSIQPDRQKK